AYREINEHLAAMLELDERVEPKLKPNGTLVETVQQQIATLSHDCRLLRQLLLKEALHVQSISYDEAVTKFTDFVARYGEFASGLATLDDAHVQSRLDRIGQCGEETYALLWMTPPVPAIDAGYLASHLTKSVDQLLAQLSFGSMIELSRDQQMRVLESGHSLSAACEHFKQEADSGASRSQLIDSFSGVNVAWQPLRATLIQLATIRRSALDAVDRDITQIHAALGIRGVADPQASLENLLALAADLEGSSEYLEADIKRYERYLEPSSYRRSISRAADRFHDESRQLHAQIDNGARDLASLQRTTDEMLTAWEQLSRDLSVIEQRGLSSIRTRRLQQAHQELLPTVARIAAALSSR
ncbi:MAG: hypothetical protein AAF989_06660, partial [Planctomycetota bacterium]